MMSPIEIMVSTITAVSQCRSFAVAVYSGSAIEVLSVVIVTPRCSAPPQRRAGSGRERRRFFFAFRRFCERRYQVPKLMAGACRLGRHITPIVGVDRRFERHASGDLDTSLG